ncbi:MAG TPA: hypothetical protein VGG44_01130 [Tepidisphaeraceae bacterium]|jgi:hypothetical protein
MTGRALSYFRRQTVVAIAAAACALAALAAGCQTAHITHSVVAKFPGDDTDSQLSFWHELAGHHLTSNDDAFHGILLDIDGHDKSTTYAQRVATLKSRGLLKDSFDEPADVAIERGTLATIVVKVLNIRGGWVMHVFGDTQRYSLRELVYLGIFPPSSPQQTFSGSEFVGVIGRIDDSQAAVASNAPAQ